MLSKKEIADQAARDRAYFDLLNENVRKALIGEIADFWPRVKQAKGMPENLLVMAARLNDEETDSDPDSHVEKSRASSKRKQKRST